MLVGFNLTFGPMHILGLQGMSRRIPVYTAEQGFTFWNVVATVGSFFIALAVLIFLVNVIYSALRAKNQPPVGPDPWDARSLEWMTASPTPEHNFDKQIAVHSRDEFWHRKWGEDDHGRVVRIATAEEVAHKGDNPNVHLPSPSYWPLVLAAGLPIIGYGLIYNLWLCVPGVLLVVAGAYGWVVEPADDPDVPHGHGHGDDGHGDDGHDDGDGGDDADPELPSGETEEAAPVG